MEKQIAQRVVDQWDNHDKFRVNESSLWSNGIEPDDVAVARAYLLAVSPEPIKFNFGELSQDEIPSGLVLLFENGLVLKSKSLLWMGKDDKVALRQQFDSVMDALSSSASFEFSADVS